MRGGDGSGDERDALPPLSAGEGGPRRGSVGTKSRREGTPVSGTGAARMKGTAQSCTVAPLSRPGLTAGPPFPAEGGASCFAVLSPVHENT
ncbi:hypothetical protein MHIMP23_14430 [Methylobacterium hispanicum]